MALKAGRVGVAPDQVDKRGKVTGAGLTPEQQAKLDRALLVPVQAPVESKIVGVSSGRDQLMLGLGAGLAIEGGQLVGTEVPEYSVSDAGKVLKVDANGDLIWADPPQGGGIAEIEPISTIDNYILNQVSGGLRLDFGTGQHVHVYEPSGNNPVYVFGDTPGSSRTFRAIQSDSMIPVATGTLIEGEAYTYFSARDYLIIPITKKYLYVYNADDAASIMQ